MRVRLRPGPLLLAGSFLAFGACSPPPAEEPTESVPGPEPLVDAWVEMWNSYDLDRLPELFLADDRLTYFSSEREGLIRGFDAVVEHHRGFGFVPGGTATGSRLWLEELDVQRFGDAAVVTAIWFFQGAQEGEAPEVQDPQRGPVTIVCLLEEGGWRFVHMNFSEYLPPR
jgi:ketosteroid isomerase-like protein